jgi:hypothetical protein
LGIVPEETGKAMLILIHPLALQSLQEDFCVNFAEVLNRDWDKKE